MKTKKSRKVQSTKNKKLLTKKRLAIFGVAIFVGLGIVAGITGYYLTRGDEVEAGTPGPTNPNGTEHAVVNGSWLGFEMRAGIKEGSKQPGADNNPKSIKMSYRVYERLSKAVKDGKATTQQKEFYGNIRKTIKQWSGQPKAGDYIGQPGSSPKFNVSWVSVPAEILLENNWYDLFNLTYAGLKTWSSYNPTQPPSALYVAADKKTYLPTPSKYSRLSFTSGEFENKFSVYYEEPGTYVGENTDVTSSIGSIGDRGELLHNPNWSRARFCLRLPINIDVDSSEVKSFGFLINGKTFTLAEKGLQKLSGKSYIIGGKTITNQVERNYRAGFYMHNQGPTAESLFIQKMRGGLKAPSGLKSTANNNKTVKLTWNRLGGFNAAKYRVMRREENSSGWKLVKIVENNLSEYTDNDSALLANKRYAYKIGAVNYFDNNIIDYTAEVSVQVKKDTGGDQGDYPAPSNFKATAGNKKITLNWNIPAPKKDSLKGYRLLRSDDNGKKYNKIKDITNPSTISYTNSGLTNNKKYHYRIYAVYNTFETKGRQLSQYLPVSATPKSQGSGGGGGQTDKYSAPRNFKATAGDQKAILKWDVPLSTSKSAATVSLSTDNILKGYRLLRSNDNSKTFTKIVDIQNPTTTSYTNSGLTNSKRYYYRVYAVYNTFADSGIKLSQYLQVSVIPNGSSVSQYADEDVNMDRLVNWLDVGKVLAYIGFPGVKIESGFNTDLNSNSATKVREDVNRDGIVDWLDIGKILSFKGFPQSVAATPALNSESIK